MNPPDSELAQIILYGAGILLLGVFGWILKTLRDMTLEMGVWRVALFGMRGDNGLAGDVKQLRLDVDEMLGLDRRHHARRAGDTFQAPAAPATP